VTVVTQAVSARRAARRRAEGVHLGARQASVPGTRAGHRRRSAVYL